MHELMNKECPYLKQAFHSVFLCAAVYEQRRHDILNVFTPSSVQKNLPILGPIVAVALLRRYLRPNTHFLDVFKFYKGISSSFYRFANFPKRSYHALQISAQIRPTSREEADHAKCHQMLLGLLNLTIVLFRKSSNMNASNFEKKICRCIPNFTEICRQKSGPVSRFD